MELNFRRISFIIIYHLLYIRKADKLLFSTENICPIICIQLLKAMFNQSCTKINHDIYKRLYTKASKP